MTTHVRLVSTIDVATVPRHLNAALNWAFDEGNWRNALSGDESIHALEVKTVQAHDRLRLANSDAPLLLRDALDAPTVLDKMLNAFRNSNLDARLVVE